ncbi:hypothetical protein K493DRAFT_303250 [Basidiobolus meristosporus CBS 931.73]|uniref:Uncharacterized protein n=1 Tax=Basidiobolus meristosporus CBS 931.73 TaxID=1314790 RepID=A0A1Y1Y4F4_9FUNG|nr:hypothetical protein K493DRAFT_303250 [Basidiobolus meristosporus CBS 931.73]|eukprot:ORX92596.1 hypothetical protein K493DRAFT_303250 [Basidiobolus meristosporus CBS 931.73]
MDIGDEKFAEFGIYARIIIAFTGNDTFGNIGPVAANNTENIITEDLLEVAIQEEDQEKDEIDLAAADVSTTREVYNDPPYKWVCQWFHLLESLVKHESRTIIADS